MITDPLKLPFAKVLQDVQRVRLNEAYRILVTCAACALTAGQQEALYLETIKGLDKRDRDTIAHAFAQLQVDMEAHPYQDLLGPVYMEIGHHLDRKYGAEFFTPHSLSVLLAQMTFGDKNPHAMFKPGEILMASEPACGSGGMILAATQVLVDAKISPLHMRWVAQDISSLSCYAAFVNLSLWGIPARIVCGDTLSNAEPRWQWETFAWALARPLIPADAEETSLRKLLDFVRGMVEQAVSQPEVQEPVKKPAPFGAQFGPLFGGEL